MTISTWTDEKAGRVASALVTFGQIGFWIQLVFLIVVVILGGYVFRIIGGTANLDNLLALLGLVLPRDEIERRGEHFGFVFHFHIHRDLPFVGDFCGGGCVFSSSPRRRGPSAAGVREELGSRLRGNDEGMKWTGAVSAPGAPARRAAAGE